MSNVAFVVIGRNEGNRLEICLDSLLAQVSDSNCIVYVDSGSTDGSCKAAHDRNISVIELDLSIPFTAARARNAGWTWLCENYVGLRYIQFIDGDCELVSGWLDQALTVLDDDPTLAVVCGRRRERYPDSSPYNRLADMEWDTPVGDALACGGDALIRVSALRAVNGYNPKLICGEEPEMCIRMRQAGWNIRRIGAEMTLHDADMHQFGQWWKRSVRGGWAVAEGYAMYGSSAEHYMAKENTSGWLWGFIVPLLAFGLVWFTMGMSLLLFTIYLLLAFRIYIYRYEGRGDTASHARLYALMCTISKFPQMLGQASYWLNRWRGRAATLIEYKAPAAKGV